jgi:hypothetical protein
VTIVEATPYKEVNAMARKFQKLEIWSKEIEDKPGETSRALDVLSAAGADLQFVLARRRPEKPGRGILFVAPLTTKKQKEAALREGFNTTVDMSCVVIQGKNKPGLGGRITKAISESGVNLRGMSAGVVGSQFVAFFVFDNMDDAAKGLKGVSSLN